MDMRGCVWVGDSFLSHGKRQIKLLSVFFLQFIFYILQMTQTSRNNNYIGFQIFTNGYGGMCTIGGKFLKEWQVTDKIIESIFSQFAFNHLQMTQTQ